MNRRSVSRRAGTALQALIAALLLLGLGERAPAKGYRTEIGETPWAAGATPKVVYGTDDRIDVYEESDPERLKWAASTCGLVTNSGVTNNGDGTYTLFTSSYRRFGVPACPGEPFGGQPTAMFCTGFMVGPDLIATAGHCFSESDLTGAKFVFGFVMEDATTAVTTVGANQVYTGVEVVARALGGSLDFAVVRVDREIVSPGATPFQIRREGTIPVGTQVGVIGHPAGLPLKLAFSASTRVRENSNDGFFVANLDTYGGNSGSPVINPFTGVVEGILVRGETDYVLQSSCFISNTVPDDGGRGEDVSKTTTFMAYVPEVQPSLGRITLSKPAFRCTDTMGVELRDDDLAGLGAAAVSLTSATGDSESLTLLEREDRPGIFVGSISVVSGPAVVDDGTLQGAADLLIHVAYDDEDDGSGQARLVTESAPLDCRPPELSNFRQLFTGGTVVAIGFDSSEPGIGRVHYGTSCAALTGLSEGTRASEHVLIVTDLTHSTEYFYAVEVTDDAGNSAVDMGGWACHSITTTDRVEFLTQRFVDRSFDLRGRSVTFVPSGDAAGYAFCTSPASGFPSPLGGLLLTGVADDASIPVALEGDREFPFFGEAFRQYYIGSNGYITFGQGDTEYQDSIVTHFALKRISALFTDLNPLVRGRIWREQRPDRVVVTYDDVPTFRQNGDYQPDNSNTFQVEMFFNGVIRVTYLNVEAANCIAGLSRGLGLNGVFEASDLSAAVSCLVQDSDGDGLADDAELTVYGTDPLDPDTDGDGLPDGWEAQSQLDPLSAEGDDGADGDPDGDGLSNAEEYALGTHPRIADSDGDGVDDGMEVLLGTDPTGSDQHHDADYSRDWVLGFSELLRLIQYYNLGELHCDSETEDGYSPGPGKRECRNHTSDYMERDWSLSLAELLRGIQLHNSGGYRRDIFGEDGYAPGRR